MATNEVEYAIMNNTDKSGGVITDVCGVYCVSNKSEAKREVLKFLYQTRAALPRKPLYRNLAYRGWDKSDGTLQNYLNELQEEGFVARVDANKFAEGVLKLSDDDPGYWVITSDGVSEIDEESGAAESDIDDSHL